MDKIKNISISISLLIHAAIISGFSVYGLMQNVMPKIQQPQHKDVTLQFIDTPDVMQNEEQKEDTKSKVISDKNIAAKDMNKKLEVKPGETAAGKPEEIKQYQKNAQGIPGEELQQREQEPVKKEDIKKEEKDASKKETQGLLLNKERKKEEIKEKKDELKPVKKTMPDTSGKDIVNLPALNDGLFSAPNKNGLSFEVQYHKIGPYFKQIKRKIENYWLGYLVFRYPNSAPVESEAVISFLIKPTGEVVDIKVVESSGDIIFRDLCVAAIVHTSPYAPLPSDIEDIDEIERKGGLEIVFSFRYR